MWNEASGGGTRRFAPATKLRAAGRAWPIRGLGYGLYGQGFESRQGKEILLRSNSFQTGSAAHPAFYSMGTGRKAPGAWCWLLPSNSEDKDEWCYTFTAYCTGDVTQFTISSKNKHEDSSLLWCYSGHRVQFLKNLSALNVRVKQSRSWIAWPRTRRHYYRL
jgi:hypothetical protein